MVCICWVNEACWRCKSVLVAWFSLRETRSCFAVLAATRVRHLRVLLVQKGHETYALKVAACLDLRFVFLHPLPVSSFVYDLAFSRFRCLAIASQDS
jgi:hypothetical protein